MDRRWLWRAGVALLLVAFFVLLGRTAVLAFKSDGRRLNAADRIYDAVTPSSPAAPAVPPPQP